MVDLRFILKSQIVKQAEGLKIVHLNIRSLLSNLDEVKVNLLDGCFDIVALSEMWLQCLCLDNLLVNRRDRQTNALNGKTKRGGGIVIYIKNEFDVTAWPLLSVSNSDLELLCISAKLGNNRRTNLFIVYRLPTGNMQLAVDTLNDNVTELRRTTSGEVVVMGDFNIDLLTHSTQSRNLSQLTSALNVSQMIQNPTMITNRTKTLIDHLYTDIIHVSYVGTLDYNLSDHPPIFLIKKKARNSIPFKDLLCRSYREFDEAVFKKNIEAIDFFDIFISNDTNVVWRRLYAHIIAVIDLHCPIKLL